MPVPKTAHKPVGNWSVTSDIAGIVWPGIAAPAANRVLAMLFQLNESQWYSPQQLREMQQRQLSALLQHSAAMLPFYRQRLLDAGFNSSFEFDSGAWQRLPVLTRRNVQQRSESLVAGQIPAAHGPARAVKSAGSTGSPVTVWVPEIVGVMGLASRLREHQWHRRDLSRKYAAIRFLAERSKDDWSRGLEMPNWGEAAALFAQQGPAVVLDIRAPLGRQIEWLLAEDPSYWLTFPSNLMALLRYAERNKIALTLPNLEHVRTISEPVDSALRAKCEERLNVKIVDVYSAKEMSGIAMQCPDFDHYHVISEKVYCEILNEAGEPCAAGESGRVVVTPLHNFKMPLLRYDIGDYATVGEACPCRRGLPVIKRILGRVRNQVVYPNGESRFPLRGDTHWEIAPVVQFQIVQTSRHRLIVNLVVERKLSHAEEQRVVAGVQTDLDYPFEISLRYLDHIERGAGGKFEQFRSEVAAPEQELPSS